MIDLIHKRCSHPECNSLNPCFGTIPGKGTHCKKHAASDMVDVRNKRCAHEGCNILNPCFGLVTNGKGTRCAAHKLPDMENVRNKRCVGTDGEGTCPTREMAYYGDHCRYCTPDDAVRNRYKVTESRCLRAILGALGAEVIATEQYRVDFACLGSVGTRAYVDCVLDHPHVRVLLEIDEFAHSSYDRSCEEKRMHAVTAELRLQSGDMRPIAWVRLNPDEPCGAKRGSPTAQTRRCADAVAAVRRLFAAPRDTVAYVNYPPPVRVAPV